MRLGIESLLESGLKNVPQVCLEIFCLMKGEGVFLPRAHRWSIVGNFKRRQIRLKPQKEFQRRFLEDFVGYGSPLLLRRRCADLGRRRVRLFLRLNPTCDHRNQRHGYSRSNRCRPHPACFHPLPKPANELIN